MQKLEVFFDYACPYCQRGHEYLLDSDAVYAALSDDAYLDRLLENNRLAWETYRFPAVPSYRMNGKLLKSIENIGVSKQQLAAFIEQNI